MKEFSPSRLALARRRRGMTKKSLADAVGISTRSLTAHETGESQPTKKTIGRLADELGFPTAFFSRPEIDEFPLEGASFRALSKMTSRQRDKATAAGELAYDLADWIDTRFKLPQSDIPRINGIDPESAAEVARKEWGLGELPISNTIHLLESRGVRIFSLVEECKEVDAYSCWRNVGARDSVPYIFLDTMKSAERSRMDAAHELGHLVLHWRHETPRGRDIEQEANTFAAAFLMPEASVKARAPRNGTLNELIGIKRYWGVSVAALVYRMHKLNMLSEWQNRSFWVEISKRGYRLNEPNETNRETSQILAKVFDALRADGISQADVARELCIPFEELKKLVFGLVLTGMDGASEACTPEPKQKSHLRSV